MCVIWGTSTKDVCEGLYVAYLANRVCDLGHVQSGLAMMRHLCVYVVYIVYSGQYVVWDTSTVSDNIETVVIVF